MSYLIERSEFRPGLTGPRTQRIGANAIFPTADDVTDYLDGIQLDYELNQWSVLRGQDVLLATTQGGHTAVIRAIERKEG